VLLGVVILGFAQSDVWSTKVWAAGLTPNHTVELPPFPAFSRITPFDEQLHFGSAHLYLLGSDAGGRDMAALVARGSLPSLLLVALVVAARIAVGAVAGFLMGMGNRWLQWVSRGMGRWVIGFPYLALAIVVIHALTPHGRLLAFVVGMAVVGWKDIAEVVAERVEYVRSQPFALSAKAMGTSGIRFFTLHVIPHLRPALAVEIAFQASAVLVLLAELGYLQFYLGGAIKLLTVGAHGGLVTTNILANQPELGQLLSDARRYLLLRELGPAFIPAVAIAAMALSFELAGVALRSRRRFTA
jgi:ABC-type dipeptide/oligopeptide/nickel transport system permease subunit